MAINKKLIFWKKNTFNPPTSPTDETQDVLWYSIVFFSDQITNPQYAGKIWTNGQIFDTSVSTHHTHNQSLNTTDNVTFAGVTAAGTNNNSTNWLAAYNYSKVGHLPLTGGTITGTVIANNPITEAVIQKTSASGLVVLRMLSTGQSHDKGLGLSLSGDLIFGNWSTVGTLSSSWNKIWHSGNLANGTTSQYIRGDGSLATYSDTTYTTGTLVQLNAGTDTTGRLQTAKLLNDWLNPKLNGKLNLTGGTMSGSISRGSSTLHVANYSSATTQPSVLDITLPKSNTMATYYIDIYTYGGIVGTLVCQFYTYYSATTDRGFAGSASVAWLGKGTSTIDNVKYSWLDVSTNYERHIYITNNGDWSRPSVNIRSLHNIGVVEGTNISFIETIPSTAKHSYTFTDFSIASAAKLQTPRTIWGQSFDGTGNVSGAITGATTGVFSSTVQATTAILTNLTTSYLPKQTASGLANSMIYDNGTNVGIGTANPSKPLTVQNDSSTIRLQAATNPSGYFTDITSRYDAINPFDININNYGVVLAVGTPSGYSGASISYMNGYYGSALLGRDKFGVFVDPDGKVGIGTAYPAALLDVNGSMYIRGNQTFAGAGTHYVGGASEGINLSWTWWNGISDQQWMYLKDGGNVGIGTANPTATLDVAGTFNASISARSPKFDLGNGWDIRAGSDKLHFSEYDYPRVELNSNGFSFFSWDRIQGIFQGINYPIAAYNPNTTLYYYAGAEVTMSTEGNITASSFETKTGTADQLLVANGTVINKSELTAYDAVRIPIPPSNEIVLENRTVTILTQPVTSSLTISVGTTASDKINEFLLVFSVGNTLPTITFMGMTIQWRGFTPDLRINSTYTIALEVINITGANAGNHYLGTIVKHAS